MAFRNGIKYDNPIEEEARKEVKMVIPKLSHFSKPISNTKPFQTLNTLDVYNYIRHTNFKTATESLRRLKDTKRARKFKAFNFDYVTFSGIFTKRNDNSLVKHSGLITIDFDHINEIENLRYELIHDKYFETEMIFISPSGDGLKWIIPIDITQETHEKYFIAISNYIKYEYDIDIDSSGKDISRACFLPYDPQVFINPKYLRKDEKFFRS